MVSNSLITFYEDLKFRFHLDLGNTEASYYGNGAYLAVEKYFKECEITSILNNVGLEAYNDYEFDYQIYDREEIDYVGLTRVHVKGFITIKNPKHKTLLRLMRPEWFL